jgi:hypothetical protein
MHVTRDADAVPYEAPGHHGMRMRRVQGQGVTPLSGMWSACLDLGPGGRVEPKASRAGKLYLVTEGRVRFRGGDTAVELGPGDTAFVLPHEEREFQEAAGATARMYLVMLEDYPEGASTAAP